MKTVYIVATPIGNLEDITLRALKVFSQVDFILTEDTRRTRFLLQHFVSSRNFSYRAQVFSYHDYNREQRLLRLRQWLRDGADVALVSEAGSPLVSDPGYKLVLALLKWQKEDPEIKIEVVPGASAVITALQLSGLPPDKFFFVGFLPRKQKARRDFLKGLPQTTIIAFESPYRLAQSLIDIEEVWGESVLVSVCREMTKLHQEVLRGPLREVRLKLSQRKIKGEITLVFRIEEGYNEKNG